MRQEDKVATLEQCKRLGELGVVLETEKYWEIPCYKDGKTRLKHKYNLGGEYGSSSISAPDVAELGELLPNITGTNRVAYSLNIEKTDHAWMVWYDSPGYRATIFDMPECKHEAQARCAALIWLIENKHINPKDLKL